MKIRITFTVLANKILEFHKVYHVVPWRHNIHNSAMLIDQCQPNAYTQMTLFPSKCNNITLIICNGFNRTTINGEAGLEDVLRYGVEDGK